MQCNELRFAQVANLTCRVAALVARIPRRRSRISILIELHAGSYVAMRPMKRYPQRVVSELRHTCAAAIDIVSDSDPPSKSAPRISILQTERLFCAPSAKKSRCHGAVIRESDLCASR
jgi:hypothetical protein